MKDLFTVVITNYNQEKFIFEALDSVLKQDYMQMELIITDDCSKKFAKDSIIEYIEKNKKRNLQNYDFVINRKNLGTIKTLNKAIKLAKGKYILFFAADDELHNEYVISHFVDAFKDSKHDVITAQSYLYDEFLMESFGPYVDYKKALKNNELMPLDLYSKMAKGCFYAAGATAYKTSLFQKCGLFNEKYKLVEDWSYWLHLLKNNVMIYFSNFGALNHRHGGMSHYTGVDLPPHVITYYQDLLAIYETEVLQDMPNIRKIEMYDIYLDAQDKINFYLKILNDPRKAYYENLIKEDMNKNIGNYLIKIKIFNFIKWHIYFKLKNMYRSNRVLTVSFIIWFIFNLFFTKGFSIQNETIIMFSSLVIIIMINNVLNKIGDNMIICLPLSTLIAYQIFIYLSINNILVCLIVFTLIYILIYYILYILRIIREKRREE